MSGRWPRSYAELAPRAVGVLRAAALLDGSSAVASDLAIALGLPELDIITAIEELRQAGWIRKGSSDADVLESGARRWLRDELADAPPDELTALATRLSEFHTAGLGGQQGDQARARWVAAHRGSIVTAVHTLIRVDRFDEAAALAAAAWQVAARIPDPSWWRDLARCGEEAAVRGRDPVGLVESLSHSASVFAAAGDRVTAEQQWVRALDVCHTLKDTDRTVPVLTALCTLYRDWGLLDKALDVLLELVHEHESADEMGSAAHALAEIGSIMLAAGRASAAEVYLSRAAQLADGEAEAMLPAVRAAILELHGRALWLTDQPGRARRSFNHALALLVDVDDTAADRVRALLATEPDSELPGDQPHPSIDRS